MLRYALKFCTSIVPAKNLVKNISPDSCSGTAQDIPHIEVLTIPDHMEWSNFTETKIMFPERCALERKHGIVS